MHQYQSRYEHTHSYKRYLKWILFVFLILAVMLGIGYAVIHHYESQFVKITSESFTDNDMKHMEYEFGFTPSKDLYPAYRFDSGIVFDVETDCDSVMKNTFHLNPDGEEFQVPSAHCRDFFVDNCYKGSPVTIATADGGKKAIPFSAKCTDCNLFFFRNDNGKMQLLVKKS